MIPLASTRAVAFFLLLSFSIMYPTQYVFAHNEIENADEMSVKTDPVQSESDEAKTVVVIQDDTSKANLENTAPNLAESDVSLAEKIELSKEPILLHSTLRKKYSGYKLTLVNTTDTPIEIMSANVTMGMNGQTAYSAVKKSSKGGVAGILGGGLAVGLVTLGVGFALALIAAPIFWGVRHSKNKKALKESIAFTNQSPIGTLNPGEEVNLTTLVPIGSSPFLEATMRDTKTNKLFTYHE